MGQRRTAKQLFPRSHPYYGKSKDAVVAALLHVNQFTLKFARTLELLCPGTMH